MQGEVLVSGWLLSVPVRLTSVRFTSVHGELRFKGELVRFGSRLTELRLIAIRFDSPASCFLKVPVPIFL